MAWTWGLFVLDVFAGQREENRAIAKWSYCIWPCESLGCQANGNIDSLQQIHKYMSA